jgi:hypothetical protein
MRAVDVPRKNGHTLADVVFSARTHTDAIRMPYAAFATLAQPVVGDYGELPPGGKRSAAHDGRGLWK